MPCHVCLFMRLAYRGLQIIVTRLQVGVRQLQLASIGLPLPDVGEGAVGEGDTTWLNQFVKLGSGWGSRNTCEALQLSVHPLTPSPSPALGRGEPQQSSVSRDKENRHSIL